MVRFCLRARVTPFVARGTLLVKCHHFQLVVARPDTLEYANMGLKGIGRLSHDEEESIPTMLEGVVLICCNHDRTCEASRPNPCV